MVVPALAPVVAAVILVVDAEAARVTPSPILVAEVTIVSRALEAARGAAAAVVSAPGAIVIRGLEWRSGSALAVNTVPSRGARRGSLEVLHTFDDLALIGAVRPHPVKGSGTGLGLEDEFAIWEGTSLRVL